MSNKHTITTEVNPKTLFVAFVFALVPIVASATVGGIWAVFNVVSRVPADVNAIKSDLSELKRDIPNTYVRQDVYAADVKTLKEGMRLLLGAHHLVGSEK